MSNKEKRLTSRDALDQGASLLVRGIVETAKLLPEVSAHPGVLAMLSVTAPMVAFVVSRGAYDLLAPRVTLLSNGFGKAFGSDAQKVAEFEETLKDSPNNQDTIYRAFRAMVDAADPAVIESLGYMAGEYTKLGWKSDALFRGLGRALCDLEADEFEDLKAMLCGVRDAAENLEDFYDLWLDLVIDSQVVEGSERVVSDNGRGGTVTERKHEEVVRIVLSSDNFVAVGKYRSAARLFIVLKREGLAENMSYS